MRPLLLLAGLLAGLWAPAAPAAPDDDPRGPLEVRAVRLPGAVAPVLDGRLDEPAWAGADVATDFTQLRPNPGQPASQRTEALVLYDDDALYVGFRCHDTEPAAIVRRLARRDEWGPGDKVLVDIDSYGDGRTAFAFGVNAAGVKYDFLIYNDANEDMSWDAVWDVAVAEMPDGWSAEFRIPLSQLRFRPGEGPQEWGIEFQRDIARNDEKTFWAPLLPDVSGYVSRFGRLTGIEGLRSPRRLEAVPYAATRLTREPGDAADPFYRDNAFHGSVGADVKYGLTSNLTLSATVNPDFGQVEADPAVVNLSAFETFFEERRPFFVEGLDVFDYGRTRTFNTSYRPTFFYSRRIGRPPQRFLSGDGYAYVDAPDQTTIAAAAKLSGKVGPWSVGVLDAVTVEERARYVTDVGEAAATPVEPTSNYLVGRVRRDFRGGASVVGGLLTSVNRSLSGGVFDGLVPERSTVGGLDFEHRWADRTWALSGVLAGSHVAGDAAVIERLQRAPQRYFQRPDAGHLAVDAARTSLAGAYGEFSLAKTGGKWIGSLTSSFVTPGFDLNDAGFQSRADVYTLSWLVNYEQNEPGAAWLRRWGGNVFNNNAVNGAGQVVGASVAGQVFLQHRSRWGGGLWMGTTPFEVYDDRLTRGGPLARRPAYVGFNPWVYSPDDGALSGSAWGYFETAFTDGTREYERNGGFDLVLRPSASLDFTVSPELATEFDVDQFVTTVEDGAAGATYGTRYVFADLRAKSFSVGLRANWTFSPALSLQLYARPFVSAGRFTNFKELDAPGTLAFAVYGRDRGAVAPTDDGFAIDPGDGGAPFTLADPDFNFRSLRGSAVLRWEYRPGSALFFVWQQQRNAFEEFGDFDLGRDLGGVFRADVQNIFLVKATYWLGL